MIELGKNRQVLGEIGGASRDRTDDLIVANDALSQLSYSPKFRRVSFLVILSAGRKSDQMS